MLTRACLRVALSAVFSRVLDPRDLQAGSAPPLDTSLADEAEAWIDYVADTGDGFDATFTIASLLAQPNLAVDGLADALPRAQLLVLGGDQVYPTPGQRAYRDRFEGPFSAVDPRSRDDGPRLFAIPGNHDWYDGLASFLPVFGQEKALGGWRTTQRRSYFAIQLPRGWWLWGVDLLEGFPIDLVQLGFFRQVADEMSEGDRLIIVTSVPWWVEGEPDPGNGGNFAYLDRELLRPTGIDDVVMIAGDSHHYMRYSSNGGEKHRITAGGGGAFLHPTHGAATALDDPGSQRLATASTRGAEPPERRLGLVVTYPAPGRSRALALLAVLLPFRNLRFVVIPGAVAALLLWSTYAGGRGQPGIAMQPSAVLPTWSWSEYASLMFRTPVSLAVVVVLLLMLVGMADPPRRARPGWRRGLARVVMGSAHLLALVAVVALCTVAAIATVPPDLGLRAFAIAVTVAVVVAAGLGASLVLGAYFALCSAVPGMNAHGNEAFAASRLSGYKNFLRLHIDGDGVLDIYALGVRRVCRRWRADPRGSADGPRLVPRIRLPSPQLIDRVTVRADRSSSRVVDPSGRRGEPGTRTDREMDR